MGSVKQDIQSYMCSTKFSDGQESRAEKNKPVPKTQVSYVDSAINSL